VCSSLGSARGVVLASQCVQSVVCWNLAIFYTWRVTQVEAGAPGVLDRHPLPSHRTAAQIQCQRAASGDPLMGPPPAAAPTSTLNAAVALPRHHMLQLESRSHSRVRSVQAFRANTTQVNFMSPHWHSSRTSLATRRHLPLETHVGNKFGYAASFPAQFL
jgi:hypothetical protein